MSLRNQPYFPLYVQDYLTDEKLNNCSAASQGVFIKIMCVMHKSEQYGKILFKQKDKQKSSTIENFALKLSRLLPFDYETIFEALGELVDEGVLQMTDDELSQKRMVHDGIVSLRRSESAKKGGGNPILFKQKSKQRDKQNTENENEDDNEDIELRTKKPKQKIPPLDVFLDYCKTIEGINFSDLQFSLKAKYEAWIENGWRDGNDQKITYWKTKIKNTIPYLKPIYGTDKLGTSAARIQAAADF